MNQTPIRMPSEEERQRVTQQLYALMESQVQSYQKHRHMGQSTSISLELAQELMESIGYTTQQVGGVYAFDSAHEALRMGQSVLVEKVKQAGDLLRRVKESAPRWQTECRWDALAELQGYLEGYDLLHLAHRRPDRLFYPILIAVPDAFQGIDQCLFYLRIMQIENRIMAAIPSLALETFWDRLPDAALNPCEHVLINGMGKALLDAGLNTLHFETDAYLCLTAALAGATEEKLQQAADRLCSWLGVEDADAAGYVKAILPQIRFYGGENALHCDLHRVFV